MTIIDGMLRLMPTTDFAYPDTTMPYTIIEAGSVVDTVPFTVMNPLTRYKFEGPLQSPTTVLLSFMGPPTPFRDVLSASGIASSDDAIEVAKCFDQLFALKLPDLRDVINIIEMHSAADMAKDFRQKRICAASTTLPSRKKTSLKGSVRFTPTTFLSNELSHALKIACGDGGLPPSWNG